MYYYEFLNKLGVNDLSKGRMYPRYKIHYDDYYEEQKQFVHYFRVDSSMTSNVYEVEIKNNGDQIYDGTCTCPQYKNYGSCKHIAACLINYRQSILMRHIVDLYKESKSLLDYFYEPDTDLNIKEKLNLELSLNFYDNECAFRLYIGPSKLYVLNTRNKFHAFLNAFYNGGDFRLGTKFIYNNNKYFFDEESTKIIEYLSSFERNAYYDSEAFNINDRDFLYIINNVTISKLKINNKPVKEIKNDIPATFNLIKNKQKDYELIYKFNEDLELLTGDLKYMFHNNILYIVPDNYCKLFKELSKRELRKLIFKPKDLDKFSRGVLKKIQDKITIASDISAVSLTKEPDAEIYFDIGNILTCKINFKYGSKTLNMFEKDAEILRNYTFEEKVLQDVINNGFKLENKKIIMNDIESIGYFLENGLNNLNSKYKIFTSKNMNNISLIKKSHIMKDFSIGTSGIMSFNFSIDNINPNELKEIFSSLESNKTYHKLKNGNIINLEEDTELQDLNSLIKDLELDTKNLTESIEIPKYRALYIDSLRESKYHDITTNNMFDDFISNFKKYQDIKIEFSKEDESILRDYQKIGVRWLYALHKCDLGGILADEMGLGKSIETICFIKEVLKNKPDAKILIVCPTSLVYNWKKEFDKFGSNLKYTTLTGDKNKRMETLNSSSNIYITSYGLLRNDIDIYKEINFEICIIDEAQYIKNYQAKMTISLKKLNTKTRIALTGTPIENSVTELWSIFDFLMPGYLNSIKKFHEKYHISDIKEEDLKRLENLNYQIKPFILRRKKKDVSQDLPDKTENNIYLELPENQKKIYLSVLKETENEINEVIENEGFQKARFKILTLLTKLRQICIDPNVLYTNYEGESIKIEKIIEMIKDYAKENHKILIFSSFRRVLDRLKINLDKEHISYYSIDGSVNGKSRPLLVDKFNNDNTTCFLITLKSGGTGLNLTSADIVIHLDIWWNPQVENQATDRAHRIGQTKKVIVNKLITKGTIEERILELQEKKRILSENLIEGNTSTESLSSLTEEELKALLTFNQD